MVGWTLSKLRLSRIEYDYASVMNRASWATDILWKYGGRKIKGDRFVLIRLSIDEWKARTILKDLCAWGCRGQ